MSEVAEHEEPKPEKITVITNGTVTQVDHVPGEYHNADTPKAKPIVIGMMTN